MELLKCEPKQPYFCIFDRIAQQIKNIFDMQASKSKIEDKLKQLTQKMAQAAGKTTEQLTRVEQTVIFAHALNQEFGLQCIARNGDRRYFPDEWSQAKEGVYKFNYSLKPNEGSSKDTTKIVQFRFINNQQSDGSISVNYSLEDSEQLHQYELKFDKDKVEEYFKAYQKHLEQKLRPNKSEKKETRQTLLQPQWREPLYQQPRQPYPIFVPNQSTNPFNVPYGGGEYIGPDNQIFRGRGSNNPFGPIGSNPQSINDPRRPPGSRFDPIDPFGSLGVDEKPRNDFMGFNEFGQPFSGNKSGFNPGRFL